MNSFSWITYDSDADALYIHLKEPASYHKAHTKDISDDVVVDTNDNGEVTGIEILSPSEDLLEAMGL